MRNILFIITVMVVAFTSCEPYEDYTRDFDYTTVYFATQKPLRTIVAYNEMQFKVGVALGGKRENNKDEFADFEIDETLLTTVDGADAFTLLPSNYYTLSDASRMIIPQGNFIGDVTVTLDKDLFTNDPLAVSNNYALPLRITNSSLDFIGGLSPDGTALEVPKDYTILVVKYISPYSGTFYHKGIQRQLDSNGNVVEETEYNESDLIKNETWDITTVDRNSVKTDGIGTFSSQNFVINVNEADNTVTIDSPSGGITNLVGSGSYNSETGTFTIDYSFTLGGTDYEVEDTLIVRNRPEFDLRFEEW